MIRYDLSPMDKTFSSAICAMFYVVLVPGCNRDYFTDPPTPSVAWALVESRNLCDIEHSTAMASPLVSERHRGFFADLCRDVDTIMDAVQDAANAGIDPEGEEDARRAAGWAAEMTLRYNLWLRKFADESVPCSVVLEACDWLGEYCSDNSGDVEELKRGINPRT